MKLSYLWHGPPGHPIHPPLTDATIGSYTVATVYEPIVASVSGGCSGWPGRPRQR